MNSEPYRNSNMDQRPGNTSLFITAAIQCVVSGLAGGLLLAAILMFSRGIPFDALSWSFTGFGAATGFVTYLFKHFRYAKTQRIAFITAGGDATGISLFMFGAMGGKLLPNGIWQWHDPNSDFSSGDGSY